MDHPIPDLDEMYETVLTMMDSNKAAVFAILDGAATIEWDVEHEGTHFDVMVSWTGPDSDEPEWVALNR